MADPRLYYPNETDRIRLKELLEVGVPMKKINERMGVAEGTLRKHYPDLYAENARPRGPAPHEPTPESKKKVMMLASIGTPKTAIAMVLDMSVDTLDAHYAHDLEVAIAEANARVTANLFNMATGDKALKTTVTAAMFWAKARMGWVETNRTELTGAEGKPLQHQVMVTLPDNGRGDTSENLLTYEVPTQIDGELVSDDA